MNFYYFFLMVKKHLIDFYSFSYGKPDKYLAMRFNSMSPLCKGTCPGPVNLIVSPPA